MGQQTSVKLEVLWPSSFKICLELYHGMLGCVCRMSRTLLCAQHIDVSFCDQVRGIHMTRFVSSLRHLDLKSCLRFTDDDLEKLSSLLLLQHLDLKGCWRITDAGLAHLSLMSIQHLNLGDMNVTDVGLAHLSSMPLQHLNLHKCYNVTDAGLMHLSSLSLKHLNLAWCHRVTDAGLAHISSMPLQYLDLDGCYRVTDAGLAHMPALLLKERIGTRMCRKISQVGLSIIKFLNQ